MMIKTTANYTQATLLHKYLFFLLYLISSIYIVLIFQQSTGEKLPGFNMLHSMIMWLLKQFLDSKLIMEKNIFLGKNMSMHDQIVSIIFLHILSQKEIFSIINLFSKNCFRNHIVIECNILKLCNFSLVDCLKNQNNIN